MGDLINIARTFICWVSNTYPSYRTTTAYTRVLCCMCSVH